MVLIEDKAQQNGKHRIKHIWWERNGVLWERYPLPVGDYIIANEQVLDVIVRKQKRGTDVKKMDFLGTYQVCVDTKKDMQEIVGNICGQQHARFRDECILAQNNGIKLYVLIENEDGIQRIEDIFRWHNPRLDIYVRDESKMYGYYRNGMPKYGRKKKYPNATTGHTLAKAMMTMRGKYGVEFLFCRPEESGKRILSILNMKQEE